jgi:hypothetical protein
MSLPLIPAPTQTFARNEVFAKLDDPFVAVELIGTGTPPIFSDAKSQGRVNGVCTAVKFTKKDGTFLIGAWPTPGEFVNGNEVSVSGLFELLPSRIPLIAALQVLFPIRYTSHLHGIARARSLSLCRSLQSKNMSIGCDSTLCIVL